MDIKRSAGLMIRVLTGFIVFMIPVVFFQPSLDPFGPPQLMVLRVFVPLLFLLFLLRSFLDGRAVYKNSAVLLPLAGYLIVCLVSVIFSANKGISLKYLYEMTLYICGAYLIYTMSGKKEMIRIIAVIIFSHALMAAYGIMQHFGMDMFNWNTNFAGRPLGTIGNPDFFAGELLISTFITLPYFVFVKKFRALTGLALFLNLLCIYYTKVAGAYIGFGAGAAAFALIACAVKKEAVSGAVKKYMKQVIIAGIVITFVLCAGAPYLTGKFRDIYAEKTRSLTHRLLMWESSLLMIRESPVLGKGIGSYRLNYPYYQGILLNKPGNSKYDYVVTWMPHQNYLLIASEAGLLGLGLFLLAVIVFYKVSYNILSVKNGPEPGAIGFACAIAAILGASFFNTFYNIPATTLIFFIMLFGQQLFAGETRALAVNKAFIPYKAAVAALALLAFAAADGRTLAANIHIKKGDSYAKKDMYREALADYEAAIGLNAVELCPQSDVAQYYFAAEIYRKAGDLKKAGQYYREDLKINPYCPEVNNMLGAVSGQLGDLDEAVRRLELAIYLAPGYDAAYTNLVTAYVAKKDFEGARRTLKKFIAKNGAKAEVTALLKAVDAAERGAK